MALKPCKECKKEVSTSAKLCPHCGVKNPGTTTGQMLLGVIGLCAVVAAIATSCGDDKKEATTAATASSAPAADTNPPAPVTSTAPAPAPAKDLGITPEAFRKSYNAQVGQIDKSWRVAEFDVSPGSVRDTFTAKLGAGASIVGSVDKASKKLTGVMVIAGAGQTTDNMQTIAALLSTAHALTQGASKEEISDAVSTLVTAAFGSMKDSDAPRQSRIVGNRKFSATASQITGLMFTIADANE